MSKRLDDLGTLVDLKFNTEKIKARTNEILNANSEERKIFMRYKKTKIALIAAIITVLCLATAFAADGIISYFQSDKAVELTSIEELEKHNEEIGVSVSQEGYTLTLDNLAIDDNFLHVFYTITSQEGKIWENKNIRPNSDCRINGYLVSGGNNGNTYGYYVDNYTYKTVIKYNISQMYIPEEFVFEMYSLPRYDELSNFEEGYLYQDYLKLTEEDKSKLMYISLETKKSAIETENISYEINQQFTYKDFNNNNAIGKISKVIFSPFGSQFVIKDNNGGLGARRIMDMAITDDNGDFVDILISNLSGAAADDNGNFIEILPETVEENKEYSNSIEFIKGKSDMKYFTLIPTKETNKSKSSTKQAVGSYPLTYNINEYGKIVVTGIVIKDGEINVNYYKDGFVRGNPEFVFLDKDGNSIDFGRFPGTFYNVHHDNNYYTFAYYYEEFDNNGRKPLPSDGSLSKESLEQRFASLEVIADNGYTLDYDNAVKIDLK